MTERTCATCRWWDDKGEDQGECRRHAPRPRMVNSLPEAWQNWAWTCGQDWCGEHTPKEDAQ